MQRPTKKKITKKLSILLYLQHSLHLLSIQQLSKWAHSNVSASPKVNLFFQLGQSLYLSHAPVPLILMMLYPLSTQTSNIYLINLPFPSWTDFFLILMSILKQLSIILINLYHYTFLHITFLLYLIN